MTLASPRSTAASVALCLAVLSSCRGRTDHAAKQGAEPPPGNGGTIRLVTVENGAHREALEGILEDFNRSHPGPPIVIESIAGGGNTLLGDKVRTAFAAGSPPDFFQMWPGEIVGPFIDAARLRPLDDFYARRGWDGFLIPWAVKLTERHGKRWGVPTCSHGMTFWYRADLFARHGLRPPDTYAELESICRTLKKRDVFCLSLGGKYGWLTMRLLDFFLEKELGPELHDRVNTLEESWDRPEVVAAYALLRRWVDEGWLAPGFLTVPPDEARLPFYRGTAAMVFEGDWLEAHMTREDEQDIRKYDFFLPPTDRTPRRFSAFAEMFVVAGPSQHGARLEEFFDWWLSPAVQTRTLAGISWTARKGVYPDRAQQPRMERWRHVLEEAETYRPTDQMFPKQVMDEWFEVQDGVIAGHITPREAARKAEKVMQRWKAKRATRRPAVLGATP